jgi:AAA15 family ATPase/GTPase
MIQSLHIKNFQAHKDLHIDFTKGINTIVGSSDKGKSSIIRSLRWVCFNQPSGAEFLRWGSKYVKSTVVVDDDTIKRSKKGSNNLYELNEQEYKAFGSTNVPEPIQDVLKMKDINFQLQHDAPFWFSETCGEVSRQLNAIVNLQIIDSVTSAITSKTRTAKINKETAEENYDKLKIKEKELRFIEIVDEEYKKIEELEEIIEDNEEQVSLFSTLINKASIYAKEVKRETQRAKGFQLLLEIGEKYKNTQQTIKQLSGLVSQSIEIESILKQQPPSFDDVENEKEAYENIYRHYTLFHSLVNKVIQYTQIQNQYKQEIILCDEKIKERIGNRCPLCDTIIK